MKTEDECIVYKCNDHADIIKAVRLSGLNMEIYGGPKHTYPHYIGWRCNDTLPSVVSTNSNENFEKEDWLINAVEFDAVDIYELFGMKGNNDGKI